MFAQKHKNQQYVYRLYEGILDLKATDPKLKTRYSSCLENYNDGIDDLRGLPALLKSRDYSGLNIHASAALDDPSTCDDNFSDPPAEAPQLKVASEKVQGLIGGVNTYCSSTPPPSLFDASSFQV
ncbi:hypothetical protein MTR67_014742 [Solanum verrucosum]|uniref:Pectinesterase inhibitor domain-containing protein n=1 Tax=Solanum verrucosum TaxID=315347 RepID=A0AAF0QCU6_SOLVR|nr:hypothetical protein MTR67_014742 [Solanum verrucosum]